MVFEIKVACPRELKKEHVSELGLSVDEEGVPLRDYDDDYVPTYIAFDTIEKLMSFIVKYGKVVLTDKEIVIYNGYRE